MVHQIPVGIWTSGRSTDVQSVSPLTPLFPWQKKRKRKEKEKKHYKWIATFALVLLHTH